MRWLTINTLEDTPELRAKVTAKQTEMVNAQSSEPDGQRQPVHYADAQRACALDMCHRRFEDT